MNKNLDEDLIEATIRRVAEAKAAREAAGPAGAAGLAGAAQAASEPETLGDSDPADIEIDEDQIAATIRRVEAAKAAMQAAAQSAAVADEAPAPDEALDIIDEGMPAHEAARESARRAASLLIEQDAPSEPTVAETPGAPASAMADDVSAAVARIEKSLQETSATLRALIARFESVMPMLERLASAPPAPPPLFAVRTADDGDEPTPAVTRGALAAMPRPAVFRDLPRPASGEQHNDAAAQIDTRPLPEPLPPIHAAEPKRGLDLLPRTYRITVEDKRRGVDLVPLHRALLGMDGVRDMSLLSYNNGIAIVSLETVDSLDPEALEAAVSRAMARPAHVEVHNDHTMVVKLED